MNWYSALIEYRTSTEDPQDPANLREESIRIILATSDTEAKNKAEAIGRQDEHSYNNDKGELIKWNFIRVIEVQDLCEDELHDGTEVFSRLSVIEIPGGADDKGESLE